jgi:hypothetical protein
MVISTQGEPPVVSMTTVSCIRKRNVFIFIVAYPLAATFGTNEIFRRTTDKTFLFLCHFSSFLNQTHTLERFHFHLFMPPPNDNITKAVYQCDYVLHIP